MYVKEPQHSITGGDPPQYIQVGGEIPPPPPPTLPGSTPMATSHLWYKWHKLECDCISVVNNGTD